MVEASSLLSSRVYKTTNLHDETNEREIKRRGLPLPIVHRYEAHAGILEAENTSLRDRNVALELRLLDSLRQSTSTVPPRAMKPASTTLSPDLSVADRQEKLRRHQQPPPSATAASATATAAAAGNREEVTEEEREAAIDQPEYTPTAASRCSGGGGGASGRFRVDGRVVRSGVGAASTGEGTPMCAAVLKDLRRRLKEAELEAREMRAERAAMDKRDRLVREGVLLGVDGSGEVSSVPLRAVVMAVVGCRCWWLSAAKWLLPPLGGGPRSRLGFDLLACFGLSTAVEAATARSPRRHHCFCCFSPSPSVACV